MKKYIIGVIAGFMLSLGVGAHAEVSNLVDQVVQGMFPVTINGQPLGDAIVVDDKTYLPVREFGEAVGYAVTFTDTREVVMTKNEATPAPLPTTDAAKEQRKKEIHAEITKNALEIQTLTAQLGKEKGTSRDENGDVTYNGKATMDQTIIDALQKQIDDRNARIQALVNERNALQ